jgi:hypothetical protein
VQIKKDLLSKFYFNMWLKTHKIKTQKINNNTIKRICHRKLIYMNWIYLLVTFDMKHSSISINEFEGSAKVFHRSRLKLDIFKFMLLKKIEI